MLKESLEKFRNGAEDWQSIVVPTNALISAGIKSPVKTLQILKDEDSVLELFLPFDMEFTYGAAMHVAMAGVLFHNIAESQSCVKDACSILDQMVERGSKLAAARKSELVQLEAIFLELATQIERRGLEALTLPYHGDYIMRVEQRERRSYPLPYLTLMYKESTQNCTCRKQHPQPSVFSTLGTCIAVLPGKMSITGKGTVDDIHNAKS
ncbi:hypothetical protein BDW59DRAFT_159046 [Aspergillus cavernicola]|uniref:Uncharacterized protein n=1 Tax=Aspergillus cavernicola TaxID=176166 RepID=A0ABR4INV1_9EURO